MSVALLGVLLVCMPRAGEGQTRSAAATGFYYASISELRVDPGQARVCEPDRKVGALAGAFAGLISGAIIGSGYRLYHIDASYDANHGTIPFQTFLLVGTAAGTVFGIVRAPVVCRRE